MILRVQAMTIVIRFSLMSFSILTYSSLKIEPRFPYLVPEASVLSVKPLHTDAENVKYFILLLNFCHSLGFKVAAIDLSP